MLGGSRHLQVEPRRSPGTTSGLASWVKDSTNAWLSKVRGASATGLTSAATKLGDISDVALSEMSDLCIYVGTEVLHVQDMSLVSRFDNMALSSTLPLLTVSTIMGTLYVSFVCMYVPAMGLAVSSAPSVAFHTAFVLALSSYVQGVVVDPGSIPDDWRPDEYDDAEDGSRPRFPLRLLLVHRDPAERKKTTGEYRFCNKEQKFKPDRAHYCSALNRNVLRMDHFCPWLTNCVGFKNHKFFVLCLFYTTVACSGTGTTLLVKLSYGGCSAMHSFMMLEGAMLSLLMSSVVGPFFAFHCWLLGRNMTTIEYCEKRGCSAAPGAETQPSPWDVGVLDNIRSVMGQKWFMWFLPVGCPPGNGIDFASRSEVEPSHPSDGSSHRAAAKEDIELTPLPAAVQLHRAQPGQREAAAAEYTGGLSFLLRDDEDPPEETLQKPGADNSACAAASTTVTSRCEQQQDGARESSDSPAAASSRFKICTTVPRSSRPTPSAGSDSGSVTREPPHSETSPAASASFLGACRQETGRHFACSFDHGWQTLTSAAQSYKGAGLGLMELCSDTWEFGKRTLESAPLRLKARGSSRRKSSSGRSRRQTTTAAQSPPRGQFSANREPAVYPAED
mmetsp:Transcript_68467/g.164411  ORF Transcript_68467/g.164411 Transcript_68467/m.164411 type:complete len:617 (+) Transcript_68467:165-2015(+)